MTLDELLTRLRHSDQWARVEALRILAMVEETRALKDIEWVYKNDPEPGVRQVAQWAGRIIYGALKQAKTVTDMHPVAEQTPPRSDGAQNSPNRAAEREEALISSLLDSGTYEQMREQMLARELTRTFQASAAPASGATALPPAGPIDLFQLLDAGLSEDFFRE